MGFLLQWISLSLIFIGLVSVVLADTVYDALGRRKDLSKFHEMVNRDELLRMLLQRYPITVFAPTNEAIERNKASILGRENSVVAYHILTLFANKSSFPFFVYTTSLPGSPPLYGGIKRYPGSRKE